MDTAYRHMGYGFVFARVGTKALWVGLQVYDPDAASVLKGYKAKYRKLPTLGDDVTDDEGDEGEEGKSDGDVDSD